MADPTTSYQVTSNIPPWAQERAEDLLAYGAGLTFPKQKIDPKTGQPMFQIDPKTGKQVPVVDFQFTPYAGELVAKPSPLQYRAWEDLSQMGTAPQLGQATGFTGLAALQAQNLAQYDPMQAQQYYRSPFERRRGGGTGIDQYMSPYMQGVVEQQKQQAVQDYMRQIPGTQFGAARSGARGGTRDALVRAEGQRNLQQQLQGIQATGLQNAYQQATQQAMQEAQNRAQFGLQGQQLAEQSRQYGAGLGLQGLQQQLAAANQLANIGQMQYGQQAGILQAQQAAGAQQQALKQQMLSSDYQRFIDEQQYPYKQLEFYSNLLRGIPSSDKTTTIYEQPPSVLGQVSSLTGGLGGIFGSK